MSTKKVRKPAPKKPPAKKPPKEKMTLDQRLAVTRQAAKQAELEVKRAQARLNGLEGQVILLQTLIEERDDGEKKA